MATGALPSRDAAPLTLVSALFKARRAAQEQEHLKPPELMDFRYTSLLLLNPP